MGDREARGMIRECEGLVGGPGRAGTSGLEGIRIPGYIPGRLSPGI